MTKFDLSKLKDLNKEIELLQRQISDAYLKADKVYDTVKGSSPRLPYSERVIRVSGIDWHRYDRKVASTKRNLQRRVDELMDAAAEINDYIAAVPDCEVRMILQCKYVSGLTWDEIEVELGMNERTARRKFRKWWENC